MKSQGRLLILDPFENLLQIYQMFLENEKFSVDTASN
jgi:hypothetical protein